MSAWIIALTLFAGGLALTALIVYAAERDLRRRQERREARAQLERWMQGR